jgi:hypothetical protein
LENLEVEYIAHNETGRPFGYKRHIFDRGMTYEFDGDDDSIQLLHRREDTDMVWIHITVFENYFREVEQ